MGEHIVSSVSSAIAVALIEERLRAGGTVDIPSLGITLTVDNLKERLLHMLTPEERAKKIIEDEHWQETEYIFDGEDEYPVASVDTSTLAAEITAAIHAAVLAERERAARACDQVAAESGDHNAVRAAEQCAAAIRSTSRASN